MSWSVRSDQNVSEFAHYGVKGMKWGIRKEYEPHPRKRKKSFNLSKKQKIALRIAGGLALTAASVYAYNKIGQDYMGGVLKAGTSLHSIMTTDKIDYGRQFYASYLERDRELYRIAYGSALKVDSEKNAKVFDNESVVAKSIRYPSNKQAEKIFKEMLRDKTFRELVGTDDYNSFNQTIGYGETKAIQKFYEELKKKGYSALIDTNDQKGVGYSATRPVIIFDSSNLVKGISKELHDFDDKTLSEIRKIGEKAVTNAEMRRAMQENIPVVAGLGSVYAIKIAVESKQDQNNVSSEEAKKR